MSLHAIATVGLRTIQQIATLHDFRFHHDQNGLAITKELLASSLPGAPVVDTKGHFIGFISQFDVLSVLEAGRDVSQLTAEEIMVQDHIAINISTPVNGQVHKVRHAAGWAYLAGISINHELPVRNSELTVCNVRRPAKFNLKSFKNNALLSLPANQLGRRHPQSLGQPAKNII